MYERLAGPGKKAGFVHVLLTQLVTAFWHGVYPGYLIFFVGTVFYLQAARVIYRAEQVRECAVLTLSQALHAACGAELLLYEPHCKGTVAALAGRLVALVAAQGCLDGCRSVLHGHGFRDSRWGAGLGDALRRGLPAPHHHARPVRCGVLPAAQGPRKEG